MYLLPAAVQQSISKHITLRVLLLASLVFRVVLLLYGEWQDENFTVKFTDIDYHVFSDASRHVSEGHSPFLRSTYRYTPLLALMLVPNHFIFYAFGKLLFIGCDILVGWLIYEILGLERVKDTSRLLSVSVWLLNPLTATVSARGNAESFLATLVTASIFFLLQGNLSLAAVAYGTAVHVKIFPVIYALPILLFLKEKYSSSKQSANKMISWPVNGQGLKFSLVSLAMFSILTGMFYVMYGQEFIKEAYLYHVTRRDIKHNFSVYFYLLYLIQETWLSLPIGLLAFLPQAILLLVAALRLHKDIAFCCFVQTIVFVTFNKVCTSQYFLWYLSLLPLILPFSKMGPLEWLSIGILWFAGQGMWLLPAYYLEFQGYNTFIFIWLAGLLFFIINVYILTRIIKCHNFETHKKD